MKRLNGALVPRTGIFEFQLVKRWINRRPDTDDKNEISNVTQPVFDVIPEDVKKPHVHDDMKESPVEKHGCQERRYCAKAVK